MDSAQAAQMIAWLDEENRRAKAQLSELRDLFQKQAIELADQRKRYEDLQGRLTRLQTDVSRQTQVDQAIQQLKDELASVLQDVRDEIRRSDQQALQSRQLEREAETKGQLDLSQRVERLSTLPDKLTTQVAEQQRQNEIITGLRQRIDAIDKELVRRNDQARLQGDEHKRDLGRIDALQQALDALRAQIEPYSARLQYMEKWAQNSAQRTADLQTFRADMVRVQNDVQEGQRRAEQRIERQIREWSTITESVSRDQEARANQLRIFAEQHERTKKALSSLQDLAKELRVAQEEARQVLDLGLEKQRRELREWQGENEKRWTRYMAQWDYRWSEQAKADEGLIGRLEEVEAARLAADKELQALRAAQAGQGAEAKAAVAELWRALLEAYQRELEATRAVVEKLNVRVVANTPPPPPKKETPL